jgi:transcriptional regulator with XRE-family HTH domain
MDRLAELRERRALTLRELSVKSGVAADTINQIELGHRRPRPSTLRKLARALEVDVEEFYTEPILAGKAKAPSEAGQSSSEWTDTLEGFAAAVGSVVDRTQRKLDQTDGTNGDALVTLFEETFVAQMGAERILEQVDEKAAQTETPEARRARVNLEHAVLRLTDLFGNIIDALGLDAEKPAVVEHREEKPTVVEPREEYRRRSAAVMGQLTTLEEHRRRRAG